MQLNLVECKKMSNISENNMRHWQQCSFDTSPADVELPSHMCGARVNMDFIPGVFHIFMPDRDNKRSLQC
jgi:hypothetical protein